MTDQVRIERSDGLLAITLARPERRNAITVAMYAAMADAIGAAAEDESIRLITIRGEGVDFAAGNDLGDFLAAGIRELTEEAPVWRLLRALATCRTPLVAAVQGNCVGIGTTMLLHCDLVVAEDGARFSLPFVELGLVPEAGSTLILPQLAGRRRAARYLLLGEAFGVEEAVDIGLVSHRAAAGELEMTLAGIVERLMAQPAEAQRQTQKLLRDDQSERVLARIAAENACFSERLQSDEVKQAIAAFFAARAARSAG